MSHYQFTEEHRWKDLIAIDVPRFSKSIQLTSINVKPPCEYRVKLFDNNTHDIVLQKYETVEGNYENRMYLNLKRDVRILIATMASGIWIIDETNRHNKFDTFGDICVKYDREIRNGLQQLYKIPNNSDTNLKRYLNIFLNRTIKQFFI